MDTQAGRLAAASWLEWLGDMGVDVSLHSGPTPAWRPLPASPATEPVAPPTANFRSAHSPRPTTPLVARGAGIASAQTLAASCKTLDELEAALNGFDGCALKETASRLCFADGAQDAPIMLIGEAPGAEEDRQGKPFVGQSGQLLDRMLSHIGLNRQKVYITNVIYWRPPGNRAPTSGEIATCTPFLERQIEILAPSLILFVGGIAAKSLLSMKEGVTKLRGRVFNYATADGTQIPALVTFHPAYLLRQPLQKRFVWRDLLTLRDLADERHIA